MTQATVGLQQTTKPSNSDLIQMREVSQSDLCRYADDGYLYAIIDACDAPLVPPKMRELGKEVTISLFQGTAQESYWAVAPYLARVDGALLRWLVENLWQAAWGIFALSKANLLELHKHFRHFLIVTLPEDRQWFFRYYDPRILLSYLPSCTAQELKWFFGPIRAFAAAGVGNIRIVELRNGLSREVNSPLPYPCRIRPEQYAVLDELAVADFEQRVTRSWKARFPNQYQLLAAADIHSKIRNGIGRAASYGFIQEDDVSKYLDLVLVLGADFEQHPEFHVAYSVFSDAGSDLEAKRDLLETLGRRCKDGGIDNVYQASR